jgi:CheY-like chemotaxis protein
MKVLFVEDDPLNRRVVRDMLSVVGAVMSEAQDAETGLRMIDEGDYHVVLMDLRMPGMDGETAIQRVRARADEKRTIPIIVVTADTALDLKARCVESGANDFLQKPVAMAPLLGAMGRVMAARRAA